MIRRISAALVLGTFLAAGLSVGSAAGAASTKTLRGTLALSPGKYQLVRRKGKKVGKASGTYFG